MNDLHHDVVSFESRMAAAARNFPFPETPELRPIPVSRPGAPRLRRPALVWAAALLLVLLSAFAVPSVRAAVVEFFQIGVMRIFFDAPEILPDTRLPLLQELSGRTTLEEAAGTSGIPIRYPEALGEPDEIYLQTIEGPLVLMAWFEGGELEATLLALGPGAFAGKGAPQTLVETAVGGQPAAWLEGNHPLYLKTADGGLTYVTLFEAGNTLLWEAGAITYRLEGIEGMDMAIRIAETMKGTP